ncbi:MAG: flagellar hook-length control protein FliK [Aureliella sp.]
MNSKRELASAARSNDIELSSHRRDSANGPSSHDASATKSISTDDRNDHDDVQASAEDKAEEGATEGQVALLGPPPVVDSTVPKQSDDVAAISTLAADQGQSAENPDDSESANNPSAKQATSATSDTEAQQLDQQTSVGRATTADVDEQSTSASKAQTVEEQGTDKGEQLATTIQLSVQSETFASGPAETAAAQGDNGAQGKSVSNVSTDTHQTKSGQQSAAATSSSDSKARGQRREKWFERGVDSNSSKFGAQHDAAALDTVKAASKTISHGGSDETAGATIDNSAALDNPHGSSNSISQSPAMTLVPVGAALPNLETTTVRVVSSSSPVSAMDSANSLGGDQATTSTTSPESVDAKGDVASAQRAHGKTATNETQRPDALTQAERVRLVQRVSRSFSRLGPMGGQINIKLHPPQLGSLNVQVRMEGRTMTAKLSTETSAARDAILESLPVLRGRLAEQGFQISSFHVEVASNNADVASGNGNPQGSFDQSSGGDGGNQASRDVDYRRLAAQQRQQTERYLASSGGTTPRELGWQSLSSVDLQA